MDMDPALLDARLPATDWSVLPAGATSDTVAVPSGALARVTVGPPEGRRVVLVPGATGSKEDFLLTMPLLTAAGYRVESFDMAGQFESARAGPEQRDPPAHNYTLELFVDDLIAVLADRATPAHLVGYSFAGMVAAVAAARRPDLVASLTLLSTPPIPGRTFRGIKYVGWLSGLAGPRICAAFMLQGLRWNAPRVDRSRQAFVRARLRRTRISSVRDIMRLMMDAPDLAALLQGTGIPMLVAAGTGDLWSVRRHRHLATALGAELAIYRTGHSPCERTPHQLVADMVRLFEWADGSDVAERAGGSDRAENAGGLGSAENDDGTGSAERADGFGRDE